MNQGLRESVGQEVWKGGMLLEMSLREVISVGKLYLAAGM